MRSLKQVKSPSDTSMSKMSPAIWSSRVLQGYVFVCVSACVECVIFVNGVGGRHQLGKRRKFAKIKVRHACFEVGLEIRLHELGLQERGAETTQAMSLLLLHSTHLSSSPIR